MPCGAKNFAKINWRLLSSQWEAKLTIMELCPENPMLVTVIKEAK